MTSTLSQNKYEEHQKIFQGMVYQFDDVIYSMMQNGLNMNALKIKKEFFGRRDHIHWLQVSARVEKRHSRMN
jgi:hypothetical protein